MTGERARPADLVRTARRLHLAGDRQAARALYSAARDAEPDDPDALHGLGCLAYEDGEPGLAIGLIGKAIRAAPRRGAFHVMLGRALLACGHAEPARAALSVACLLEPGSGEAHAAHGEALARLGDPGAEVAFGKALGLSPELAAAWHGRGALRLAAGRAEAALADFRTVERLLPGDASAVANVGAALHELRRETEAEAALDRALALAPDRPATLAMRGLARLGDGRVADAVVDLERAHGLAPGDAAIARNAASGLYEAGRLGRARALLAGVLAADPQDRDARFTLGCIDLAEGDCAAGWLGFEARRGSEAPGVRWDGRSGAGRVLLAAEQGLGDTLMFLRFAELAAQRCSEVVLALPAAMHRLCGGLGFGLAGPDADFSGGFDAALRLGSLPGLFAPTLAEIPPPVRFGIEADAGGAAAARDRLRVGIAWAGNRAYRQDRRRSVPRHLLDGLLSLGSVAFVSLQRDGEAATKAAGPPGIGEGDLLDTARVIAGLDLVISVDSAVAHLAASLGTPTWLLDRAGGDWRWLRGRVDSPWYPSLRIFRGDAPDPAEIAWPVVLERVRVRLAGVAGQAASILREASLERGSSGGDSTASRASRRAASLRSLLIFSPNTSLT